MVGLSGPGMALILMVVTPLLFSIPNMLMVREMNSLMPHEGGYYHWVKQAFGPFAGFLAGWMNWVVSWVDVSIYPVWAAMYLSFFIPQLDEGLTIGSLSLSPALLQWIVAVIIIWLISALQVRGARFSGLFANWLGLVMIIPLVLMSGVGIYNWIQSGQTLQIPLLPQGQSPTINALFTSFSTGLFVAMWNFMGWELPTVAGSEIVKPKKTYPAAMILVLIAAFATYSIPTIAGLQGGAGADERYLVWGQEPWDTIPLAAAEAYDNGASSEEFAAIMEEQYALVESGAEIEYADQTMGTLMIQEYGITKATMEEWGADTEADFGWEFTDISVKIGEATKGAEKWMPQLLGTLVAVSAILSMIGLFIGNGLGGTRIPFAMAEDGMMPKFLVKVHPRYGTPWVSIIICGVIFSIFSLSTFQALVVLDVLLNMLVLFAEILALLVMRKKRPDLPRQKVGGGLLGLIYIVGAPALIITVAIISQVVSEGWGAIWLGLAAIAIGAFLYFPIRKWVKPGVPDVDPYKSSEDGEV